MASKELRIRYSGDASSVLHSLGQIESGHSRLGSILSSVGKVGVAAFAAVGAAAVGAIGWGVKVAADMEQAKIGFETMLGSAAKADAFLGELADFAAKTPFEFPELVTGAKRLVALGFEAENVIPIMQNVGDAVSGLGLGPEGIDRAITAIGQIQAKGRLQAEEMMQLNELGIFSWQNLADEIGVSVPKAMDMVSKGAVSSTEFLSAFMGSTGERFGGLMEKQSQSLLGLFSTLKDTIAMKLADTAGPVVESLKKAIPQVQELLGGIIDAIGPVFAQLVGSLAGAFTALLPVIAPVAQVLADVFAKVVEALIPVVEALAPHIGALAMALGETLISLVPLLPPLGELLVALAPLLPLIVELINTALAPLIPVIVGLIQVIADAVAVFVRWVQRTEILKRIGEIIAAVIGGVIAVVKDLIAFWGPAWEGIKDFVVDVWDGIKGAVLAVVDFLKEKIGGFLEGVKETWKRVWGAVKEFFIDVWNGIKETARDSMNVVLGFVNRIIDGLNVLVDALDKALGPFINFPEIPHIPSLHHGGRVTRGGLALVGGGQEELLQLPAGAEVAPLQGGLGLGRMGLGGVNVTVINHGTMIGTSPEELARLLSRPIRDELIRFMRRNVTTNIA